MKTAINNMAKHLCITLASVAMLVASSACMRDIDQPKSYDVQKLSVQLNYPQDSEYTPQAGVKVKIINAVNGTAYEAATDEKGLAVFDIVPGIYSVSASDKRIEAGVITLFNGILSKVFVKADEQSGIQQINLQASSLSQLVIKELYAGGCLQNDGKKTWAYDKYMIIYNNSEDPASTEGLCIAMTIPYMATGNNADYQDGKLLYDLGEDSWLPAGLAFWNFSNDTPTIAPGEQLVIAFHYALKNTATYSNSVDLDDASYYVTYDPVNYSSANHPAPSANIPTSHYLTTPLRMGTSTTWVLTHLSAGMFIFMAPDGVDLKTFASKPENQNLYDNKAANPRFKIPYKWALDGIETFQAAKVNTKRLLATVDAGSVVLTNGKGYSLYRNVDKEATEALESNAGKLVYGYKYGTMDINEGSTDPSDIDAEASIRQGAHIIYQDTNNSTEDFHMRRQASLRDKMNL